MTIAAHVLAVRDALREIAPGLGVAVAEVQHTPGQFDAGEIGRQSFRAPAMRVAFLGARRSTAQASEARRFDGAFAVFLITDGRERGTSGLDLVEAVAMTIEENWFSTDSFGIGLPSEVRIDALYSGELDDENISLHSVSWTQGFRLGQARGLAHSEPGDTASPKGADEDPDQEIVLTELPEGI